MTSEYVMVERRSHVNRPPHQSYQVHVRKMFSSLLIHRDNVTKLAVVNMDEDYTHVK